MADKGTTWVRGMDVITGQLPGAQPEEAGAPPKSGLGKIIPTILMLSAIALCTAVVLNADELSWEILRILGIIVILVSIPYFRAGHMKPAFVIWWLLLISECI